jgi:IMP dehydrogenase
MKFEEKYSYDDVLLAPAYSEVMPDKADTRTRLAGNIWLNIPVLSAAMDTVTEKEMAIALALGGGAGVIHRSLSPQVQADEVASVKRFLNWVIEKPVTARGDMLISEAAAIMSRYKVTGLPVIDSNRKVVGIITGRDLKFAGEGSLAVNELMTKKVITAQKNITPDEANAVFAAHRIEKLPILNDDGTLYGLITVKDLEKRQKSPQAATDSQGKLIVGAAVSPADWQVRLPLLHEAGCDFIVIDSAHGASRNVLDAVTAIKKAYAALPVIGGNVATAETTRLLIEAGADAVKVGVGPGSICTTRIVSGVGYPQLSAVYECAEEAAKSDIPVIADGGIKFSGEITKAIAAGASVVMLGNLLAGVKEAPGSEIFYEGRLFKQYRGMGSLGAIASGGGDRYNLRKEDTPVPEGVEGRIAFKGELAPFLLQLVSGLRKGMGYCGTATIKELQQYRRFIKITTGGLNESHAHNISITHEAPNYQR